MPNHPRYHGERVIRSPRVHNSWKPEVPRDIHLESVKAEMFTLTYELRNYHMTPGTTTRFHFSFMEGFFNRLCKIGNLTCKEPTLMRLLDLVCKAKDDLMVKYDKIRKHRLMRASLSAKNDEIGSSLEV
ncbi:hypothetical protein Tco_1274792 [Tanacetum coccineum]